MVERRGSNMLWNEQKLPLIDEVDFKVLYGLEDCVAKLIDKGD